MVVDGCRSFLLLVTTVAKHSLQFCNRSAVYAIRDFKIVHDGRLGRLDECHVTQNPRDI